MKATANLYLGYAADGRISMEVYAEGLLKMLRGSGVRASLIQASSKWESYSSNRWVMRWLRYISFAKQIKSSEAEIHHVLDHGYAHLYPSIETGRSIVTVHDLIPLIASKGLLKAKEEKPEPLFARPHLAIYSHKFLSRYDHIVAISQSTKRDLIDHLNIDSNSITVIPPAISDCFEIREQSDIEEFRALYGLSSDTRWVMISGREFYKNHITALKVFKKVIEKTDKPIKLLKTGIASNEFKVAAKKMNLEAHVTELSLGSSEDMAMVYNCIDCLLFPSMYEGFGMPVIEALSAGARVVCSNAGALREFDDRWVDKFSYNDTDGLTKGVLSALSRERRTKIDGALRTYIESFRASHLAPRWKKLYESQFN